MFNGKVIVFHSWMHLKGLLMCFKIFLSSFAANIENYLHFWMHSGASLSAWTYICVFLLCVFRQQELSNLLHEKKYLKALGLAISLDQPHTVLTVIKGNLCGNSFWRMGKMTCNKNSQVWFQRFASRMSPSFIISPVVDLTSRHVSLLHSLWTAALFKSSNWVVTQAFMCAQHCALSQEDFERIH